MENPIKMDDLGVPLFSETPKWLWSEKVKVNVMHELADSDEQ